MTEQALSLHKKAVYMRKWMENPDNRKRKQEINRATYARSREAGKVTQMNREHYRFKKHGTTKEAFMALIEEQGNACAICEQPGTWETLVIDHDHSCCDKQFSCGNCIRGALCRKCNTAIGLFLDDLQLMNKAADYLKKTPTEVTDGP